MNKVKFNFRNYIDKRILEAYPDIENREFAGVQAEDQVLELDGVVIDNRESAYYSEKDYFISPKGLKEALSNLEGEITINVNSPGGNVFAASRMRNQVLEWLKVEGNSIKEVNVTGVSASAGTWLIYFEGVPVNIAPTAGILIHNARGSFDNLTSQEMRNMADNLDDIDEALVKMYVDTRNKDSDYFTQLRNEDKMLIGQKAIDADLADNLLNEKEIKEDVEENESEVENADGSEAGSTEDVDESQVENPGDHGKKKKRKNFKNKIWRPRYLDLTDDGETSPRERELSH